MVRHPFCALIAALASFLLTAEAPTNPQPSVLVQVTKLQKGLLPKTVMAYGTAQADPSVSTTVTAPLSAIVGSVYIRPGQEVSKSAPLVRLVPDPQTSASYAQAVSALQNAKAALTHTQELFRESLATNKDLAAAQNARSDAEAALAALRAQGAGGPTTVRAPLRAVVTKLSVSIGTTVSLGTPLVDLAPPNSLVLLVGVVPDQAPEIMVGAKAEITPVGTSKTYTGKVILRGAVVDAGTGLVPIEISLPPGALFPGQTADAKITTGIVKGYVVPHAAILVDDQGKPYVVQAVRMKAKIVPVQVIDAQGARDLIGGKLDPNAPLVLAGNYQLQDGMRVRLSNPPAK